MFSFIKKNTCRITVSLVVKFLVLSLEENRKKYKLNKIDKSIKAK